MLILIGAGGPLGEILAAFWLIVIIVSLYLIPRSTRIRIAKRFGLGIRPSLEEPGVRASLKVRILISAFILLFVLSMLIFGGKWFRMP